MPVSLDVVAKCSNGPDVPESIFGRENAKSADLLELKEATMKKIPIVLLLAVFLLLACEETWLNLKIRFDQIQGLQADHRVIFGSNHVGQVTRVSYSKEGYYLVDLKIKEELERLKKRLKNFGREKEVEPLEKQLEKLTIT